MDVSRGDVLSGSPGLPGRACLVEGMSVREASRVFGVHRDTVGKMLANATPQGYTRQRPPRKPKTEPFAAVIDAILEADRHVPRKQRHTVKRIFERLRDEYGFEGQHTIVKDYVREHRRRVGEMFVTLTHGPGHAQGDFGEAMAVIAGVEQKIPLLRAGPAPQRRLLREGLSRGNHRGFPGWPRVAFAFLGGSPQDILYDNIKLAVAKILGGGRRKRARAFTELQSHYLFEDRFGRPSKGNDKGNVEAMVGYARRNFLAPVPRANDFAVLNIHLEQKCLGADGRRAQGAYRDHRPADGAGPGGAAAVAGRGLRGLRSAGHQGQLPVPGPVPHQWLLGAGGLRTPGRAGQGLRGPGGDQLRRRDYRPTRCTLLWAAPRLSSRRRGCRRGDPPRRPTS